MKYHPTMPVEQAQIMLRLSLKGINTGLHTYTRQKKKIPHTCTPRAYIVSVSKQSEHIVWLASEGVHRCSDLHT